MFKLVELIILRTKGKEISEKKCQKVPVRGFVWLLFCNNEDSLVQI